MLDFSLFAFHLISFKENIVYLFFGYLPVAFEKLILTTPLAFCPLEVLKLMILYEVQSFSHFLSLSLLIFLANMHFSLDCLVNFVKNYLRSWILGMVH